MRETIDRYQPEVTTEQDMSMVSLLPEIARDFAVWEQELGDGLEAVAEWQVGTLLNPENPEAESLKDRYDLQFEPVKVIRGIGATGLLMTVETAIQESITEKAIDEVTDEKTHEINSTPRGVSIEELPEYREFTARER